MGVIGIIFTIILSPFFSAVLGSANPESTLSNTHITPSNTPQISIEDWINQGYNLYNSSKYTDALNAFNRALTIDPNNTIALDGEGNTLNKLGQFQNATEAYSKALSINPQDIAALDGEGDAEENAAANLGYYYDIDPRYTYYDYTNYYGIYDFGDEFNNPALDAYNQALSINSFDADALNGLGKDLLHWEKYNAAIGEENNVLSINPQDANALEIKGDAFYMMGMYPKALDAENQSLSINPQNSNAWKIKGDVLSILGRNADARNAYNQAVSINPNSNYFEW